MTPHMVGQCHDIPFLSGNLSKNALAVQSLKKEGNTFFNPLIPLWAFQFSKHFRKIIPTPSFQDDFFHIEFFHFFKSLAPDQVKLPEGG